MLTEIGATKAQEARNDARRCSGYWGQMSMGHGLMRNPHGFQLAQLQALECRIRRGFVHTAEMLGSNHAPGPHIIDDACSALHSQLDVLSSLMFDGRESLVEVIDLARDQEAMD